MKKIIFSTLIIIYFLQVSCKKEKFNRNDDVVFLPPVTNFGPMADAGPDQDIFSRFKPVTISLRGNGSVREGNIVSYLWRLIEGASDFPIVINSPGMPETEVSGLSWGTYYFALTVSDNMGVDASDTISISIFNLELPPSKDDTIIIGEWFTGALIDEDDIEMTQYRGTYVFDTPLNYDNTKHNALSFVRRPGDPEPLYQRRMVVKIPDSNDSKPYEFGFKFGADNNRFSIYGYPLHPAPLEVFYFAVDQVKSFEYRVIVVPKTLYQELKIDWENYLEIAEALNFSP
jgi:hypothetical protein